MSKLCGACDTYHSDSDLCPLSHQEALDALEVIKTALHEAKELFEKVLSFCAEEDISHYTQAVTFREQAREWIKNYESHIE